MTKKEDHPIEIDFARKETEAGWCQLVDNFGWKATPVWFNWVGWSLLLGAQQYLFARSGSILVAVTICISVGLLWCYFQAFFYSLKFENVPVLRRFQNERVVSMILSGIMAFFVWKAAIQIAVIVLKHQS